MGMRPEKTVSPIVEDPIPLLSEKSLVFESDPFSKEHERIRHYHAKLVFKDGEFLVRILFAPYLRQH